MNRKNKVKKKKTVGDHILTIVLIVAICIFCYAAFNLYHIYTEYKKGTDEYNSISEMAVTERDPDQVEEMNQPDEQPVAPVRVDFDSLRSINEDVIGWIYMEALPEISYPVVQGEDNNFYLHQTYEKYFWILTPEKDYRYEIIAAYTTSVNSDTYTLFKGPGKEFLEYEKKMFQNSEIRTDATASEANVKDKIVTLSTCTGNQATRFVVQGKRVNAVNPQ